MSAESAVLIERVEYQGRSFRLRSEAHPERGEISTTLELGDVVQLSGSAAYDPTGSEEALEHTLASANRRLRERLLEGTLDAWIGTSKRSSGVYPLPGPPVAPPRPAGRSPGTRKPGRWAAKVGRVEMPFRDSGSGGNTSQSPASSRPQPPPKLPATPRPETSGSEFAAVRRPPLPPASSGRPLEPRVTPALPAHQRIGSYHVLETLGPDRFLAAAGPSDGQRLVELALLPRSLGSLAHARSLLRLEHANLVPVIDVGELEGRVYCVWPARQGRDGASLLARSAGAGKPLPVDAVAWIVKEVARAVEAIHARACAHGGVTLASIRVLFGGEVRLEGLSPAPPDDVAARITDDVVALGDLLLGLLGRGADAPAAARAPFVPPVLLGVASRARGEPGAKGGLRSAQAVADALAGYLQQDAPRADSSRLARLMAELFPGGADEDAAKSALLSSQAQALAEAAVNLSPVTPARASHPAPDGRNAESELAMGTVIDGRYRVERLCGRGGMGLVYEAEHEGIGRRVALKILHPLYSRSQDIAERFRREARAASRIGHPHICDVFDFGTTDDGSLYIAMEYLEGRDLGHLLDELGVLPVDRALRIAVQICRALEAAHAVGIVHRDLKPENIYLIDQADGGDFVKVLDFGVAKEFEDKTKKLTRPNIALGTPEYMAPEQIAGRTEPRSDVYALGAILYELLAGTPPLEGETYLETFRRKAAEDPAPIAGSREDVDPRVEQLVLRALARNPDDRPASMGAFADALERLLAEIT
jgi:hypothetical protein